MIGEGMNRYDHMVNRTYYIYERYEVDATFALLYHEKPLHVDDLGSFLRLSDHVIQVDDHHYFIIFAFTNHENAHKASQNLLRHLDRHFSDQSSSIALDDFSTSKAPHTVLSRLKQIMAEIRKKSYSRIDGEHVLEEVLISTH
jgi:hypothetical protein